MSQQQLDYASPRPGRTKEQIRFGWVAIGAVASVWFVTNLLVVAVAASQLDGFRGMGVAVFGAIAVNGMIVVVGVALASRVTRAAGREALLVYLFVTILLSVAAAIGDFFVAGYLHRL